MNELLAAARDYLRLGYHPIPCVPRSKRPLVKWQQYQQIAPLPEEIETWWLACPDANVALVLGRGTFAVDLDGGADAQRLLFDRGVLLPGAPRSRTAHGAHVFLSGNVPDRVGLLTTHGKKPQVDIRGAGYVIAPPSIHPDGPRYEWVVPLTETLPSAPPELLALIHKPIPRDVAGVAGSLGWIAQLLTGAPEGQRDHACTRLAGYFLGKGLDESTVETILLHTFAPGCTPPADADMVRKCVRSISKRERRVGAPASPCGEEIWTQAVTAADFLNSTDPEASWLEKHVVARGLVTEVFSPRGLGKTHVAYAIAVKLALRGIRVLLLDRDNSRHEVKRRLKAWGAAELTTFKVMLRDQVPPLTDTAAWASFPFREWDLLIIDSLDATTEGVGEKDSGKPSKAIAPMLDIAHRAEGPAILVLGNTIKSGEHSRGSGVVEDRADIAYEVRDATDLKPSGTKDWWLELPQAGASAWAERASRRKRRDSYRLAFVPSKFRVAEEPEPFVFEIELAIKPWTYRDVTAELVQAGDLNRHQAERDRQSQLEQAVAALRAEVEQRPLTTTEAVTFLKEECGLKRASARGVIKDGQNTDWEIRVEAAKGSPKRLYPYISKAPAAKMADDEASLNILVPAVPISADRMDTGRPRYTPSGPASTVAISTGAFARPNPENDSDEVSL